MHMQAAEAHRLAELPPLAGEVHQLALADEGFDDENSVAARADGEEDLF